MFSTNFLSEFVYCILNCYAHMNILQMEYAHYKCKLLLLLLLLLLIPNIFENTHFTYHVLVETAK